jgi:hypothetical protein
VPGAMSSTGLADRACGFRFAVVGWLDGVQYGAMDLIKLEHVRLITVVWRLEDRYRTSRRGVSVGLLRDLVLWGAMDACRVGGEDVMRCDGLVGEWSGA